MRPFTKPGAAPEKLVLARAMRRAPTRGEATLWAALRGGKLGEWKFRRQAVVCGYILDFWCPALRLGIEVDGAVHDTQWVEDQQRDSDLALKGVRVVRVRDVDVRDRLEEVLLAIDSECRILAGRSLPPHRGGRAGDGGRT